MSSDYSAWTYHPWKMCTGWKTRQRGMCCSPPISVHGQLRARVCLLARNNLHNLNRICGAQSLRTASIRMRGRGVSSLWELHRIAILNSHLVYLKRDWYNENSLLMVYYNSFRRYVGGIRIRLRTRHAGRDDPAFLSARSQALFAPIRHGKIFAPTKL